MDEVASSLGRVVYERLRRKKKVVYAMSEPNLSMVAEPQEDTRTAETEDIRRDE